MNIGIDAKSLAAKQYTGIPLYVHEMIKYWNESDSEDRFFLFTNAPISLDFELNDNFTIIVEPMKYKSLWIQMKLPKLLKKHDIDVFWEPMHFLPRKINGIKYAVTMHDITAFSQPKLCAAKNVIQHKLLLKPSCSRADKIISISNATREDLIEKLSVIPDKIRVIYNGDSPYKPESNISLVTQQEELTNLRIYQDYFLFVGTIEPRKNIETIIKAFDIYASKEIKPVQLVIAGGLGWKYQKTIDAINKSENRDKIILPGYINELLKEILYRNAAALLFPSLYEGLGLPILEAMSVGLPVITSAVSSMPEVGGNAALYLQDLTNADELANLMIRCMNLTERERTNLIESGICQTKKFSRESCAKELLSLLHELNK